MRWNAWHALRERTHILLGMRPLPPSTGGAVHVLRGDVSVILLDPRLDRVERHCALAHELVHDERGGGCDSGAAPPAWRPVVVREERRVDDEAVRRLVPAAELRDLIASRLRLVPPEVTEPLDVAEHFDVTAAVAQRALELLRRAGLGAKW